MASIDLDNIKVVHSGKVVLDVDALHVADSEFLVVFGPSGAGKSTLLRVIAGLDSVETGSVRIGGDDVTQVPTSRRDVAMVFQENTLFPFMSVRSNVAFPLRIAGRPAEEVTARVEAESRVLAIEHMLGRRPGELGAGHQQLVQAARALVRVPAVFLMDEPLARLDVQLRVRMRQEFRLLQGGYGVTTVYVSNDQEDAMVLADRVAVLRSGRLEQLAAPLEVYNRPVSRFVAELIGSPPMSIVPATVTADSGGYWVDLGGLLVRAWTPALAEFPGSIVDVGVRPEAVAADASGAALEVRSGYYLGSHGFAKLGLPGGTEIQMRTTEPPPRPGSVVHVKIRRLHLFHPATGRTLGWVEG